MHWKSKGFIIHHTPYSGQLLCNYLQSKKPWNSSPNCLYLLKQRFFLMNGMRQFQPCFREKQAWSTGRHFPFFLFYATKGDCKEEEQLSGTSAVFRFNKCIRWMIVHGARKKNYIFFGASGKRIHSSALAESELALKSGTPKAESSFRFLWKKLLLTSFLALCQSERTEMFGVNLPFPHQEPSTELTSFTLSVCQEMLIGVFFFFARLNQVSSVIVEMSFVKTTRGTKIYCYYAQ